MMNQTAKTRASWNDLTGASTPASSCAAKKDLIHGFRLVRSTPQRMFDRDWQSYVQQQKQQELEQIIAEEAEARGGAALRRQRVPRRHAQNDRHGYCHLPPVSRFGGGNRTERRKRSSSGLHSFLKNTSGFSGFTPTCIPVHFGVYCK